MDSIFIIIILIYYLLDTYDAGLRISQYKYKPGIVLSTLLLLIKYP